MCIRDSGGTVYLRGRLTNDGTLALNDTTGPWFFQGGAGKIVGGRVTLAGSGNLPVAGFSAGNLDGVTLAGTLDLTGGGGINVTNGLTLDGSLIKLALGSGLNFLGTQTFGGTGTVQFTDCLLYTSPSPRDGLLSRMPSSA